MRSLYLCVECIAKRIALRRMKEDEQLGEWLPILIESTNLTLDPNLFVDYEDKPVIVIVAQSIALSPDPGNITANPDVYYNKRIAV